MTEEGLARVSILYLSVTSPVASPSGWGRPRRLLTLRLRNTPPHLDPTGSPWNLTALRRVQLGAVLSRVLVSDCWVANLPQV